jgi:acetylglutamate kinase
MRIAASELRTITSGIAKNLRYCGVDADHLLLGTFYGNPVGRENRTGDITRVDCEDAAIGLLGGRVMVLAPLGQDELGGNLSFNADDAAVSVAVALGATRLILATDRDGVEAFGAVLRTIGVSALAGLISDGTITGGMVAKANACIHAANAGIPARIINGNKPEAVALALDGKCGTVVMCQGALKFW